MSRPTDDDRIEALRRFLIVLARGDDANQLAADMADLHVRQNTFPGEMFLELFHSLGENGPLVRLIAL